VVGEKNDKSLGLGICRNNPGDLDRYIHLKLSHYRPGQPTGLQEVEASRNSIQSARQDGKVVSLKHRLPLPPP